ncbi:thiol peroxidase [Oligoflexia bacterium]|nr:thiol peroxidase [Oligoflexia bacterium]
MAEITLKGNSVKTVGNLPALGTQAPSFTLTKGDLSDVNITDFAGKTLVLNIFPSIDTEVCALSVKRFNSEASALNNTCVLCISNDLPFAQGRFCGAEGLEAVTSLSAFRSPEFGKQYGATIQTGPLAGLLSRAVVIIDGTGKVVYTELVPEITQEPNYAAALEALSS